jgi:hypothetical protein
MAETGRSAGLAADWRSALPLGACLFSVAVGFTLLSAPVAAADEALAAVSASKLQILDTGPRGVVPAPSLTARDAAAWDAGADAAWPSIVLGYLPLAMAAAGGPEVGGPSAVACRPVARCGEAPRRPWVIDEWDAPHGPLDGKGISLFAAVSDRRYYAYPRAAKDRTGTSVDSLKWGGGVQVDLLPRAAPGRDRRGLFLIGELGLGVDSNVEQGAQAYRARALFGRGDAGGFLMGVAELGMQGEGAGQRSPEATFGRLGIEFRF